MLDRAPHLRMLGLGRRLAPGELEIDPARAQELVGGDRERERPTVLGQAPEIARPLEPLVGDGIRDFDADAQRVALRRAQRDARHRPPLAAVLRASVDALLAEAGAEISEQRAHEVARERAPFEMELDERPERAAAVPFSARRQWPKPLPYRRAHFVS